MEKYLTSSRSRLTIYAHVNCNTLACYVTHPPAPWQLKIAMTTTGKAHTRTEKGRVALVPAPNHICILR